ncbi:unnamed protein product [Rotaria socialis]|uniref:Tetratricopeptide repeat protein n=1 Tax=Rotaria socialis TaxID=392032 RepID=A0A818QXL6_9BILA|nr:unnamed protein product [Rotaria socialis]
MAVILDKLYAPVTDPCETKAQQLLNDGKIDQAIAMYLCIKPESARIFMIIGILYAEKKGDYKAAIIFYKKALKIQEKNGDDTSNAFTELGIAYQNLHEYDLALNYHFRALIIRKLAQTIDRKLIADSLIGIANAYWGEQNLSEALEYVTQAVTLNESVGSGNELNLATNLITLASIHHSRDDDNRALEVAKQALALLESCVSHDSPILASFLNNLGAIQFSLGLSGDAQLSFARALIICEQSLPEGHPQRLAIEKNIKRLTPMEQYNLRNSFISLCKAILYSSAPVTDPCETKAQQLLNDGKIDQAIAMYLCIKPESARIFMIIGILYAEKKGDYKAAIIFYKKALKIQEKNGDDTSNAFTELGIAYQNLHEYDLALNYHFRALIIRKLAQTIDRKLIADSLIGIANAYWGEQNLTLEYVTQAVTLNESVGSGNELNLATNLITLASIHHSRDDDNRALEVAKQALALLESCVPRDSPVLASFLNNLGAIQFSLGLFGDAQLSFARALIICEQSLPEGHPQRLAMEGNINRITEMERNNQQNLESDHWQFSLKTLLA